MADTRRTPAQRAQIELDRADAELAEVDRLIGNAEERLAALRSRRESLVPIRDYLARNPLLPAAQQPSLLDGEAP